MLTVLIAFNVPYIVLSVNMFCCSSLTAGEFLLSSLGFCIAIFINPFYKALAGSSDGHPINAAIIATLAANDVADSFNSFSLSIN